jgi:hypothetical protein
LRDLVPALIWAEQIMRKFATVTIGYRRENVFAVARSCERDLCD